MTPGVTLQFLTKPDKENAPLRDGEVATGVIDAQTAPEMRALRLFDDRWVGMVREDHGLAQGAMTAERFAAYRHVVVLRRGLQSRKIDKAATEAGFARQIATVVNGVSAALALVRETDLVAMVPEHHTEASLRGIAPGHVLLCPALSGSGFYNFDVVASAHGRRSGASLAAGLCSDGKWCPKDPDHAHLIRRLAQE